jgi:hypothetical protein
LKPIVKIIAADFALLIFSFDTVKYCLVFCPDFAIRRKNSGFFYFGEEGQKTSANFTG